MGDDCATPLITLDLPVLSALTINTHSTAAVSA
jgi:hypothetical protein